MSWARPTLPPAPPAKPDDQPIDAGTLLAQYFNPVFANTYVLAGVMSAAWPWALPFAWELARRVINAAVQPATKGGGNG